MKPNWPTVKLRDHVDLLVGHPFESSGFNSSSTGARCLRGINVGPGRVDWSNTAWWENSDSSGLSRYHLAPGDVVLAMDRPWIPSGLKLAQLAREDLPCLLVQRVARLRGSSTLCSEFLQYLLKDGAFVDYIKNVQTGTTVPHISGRSILDYSFRLPPLLEQKAIANVLGSLDNKIGLNRRINRTLDEMARAVFERWFGDIGCPSGLWGTRTRPVREFSVVNSTILTQADPDTEITYIEISSVDRGEVGGTTKYSRGSEPSRARRRIQVGDTVLSTVRPDRGAYFLALGELARCIVSTGFAVVTPQGVPWSWLFLALTTKKVSRELGKLADGGAYPAIRPEIIMGLELPFPDDVECLEQFHRFAEPVLSKIHANQVETNTLANLRDTLLSKLISGELRLRDVEKAVSSVA